jgi:hypothetical protein
MKSKNPLACRRIVVNDINMDKWMEKVDDLLYMALTAKVNLVVFVLFQMNKRFLFQFLQNAGCRKYLIKTEGSILAYTDPTDNQLGTGLDRYHPEINNKEKWGENRVGRIMMHVRDNIINHSDYAEEVATARQEVQQSKTKRASKMIEYKKA